MISCWQAKSMKTTVLPLSLSLVVVCIVGGTLLVVGLFSHRDLTRTNERLTQELATTKAHLNSLQAGQQSVAKQLADALGESQRLQARLAELEAKSNEQDSAAAPQPVSPYQAAAYLGKKSLGLAWIIPRNSRLDTNLQRYVYEPVVLLDEKLRRQFEVHHTNIVERTVEVPTYVENNYYDDQWPYYWSYPWYGGGGTVTNRPPRPNPPVASQPIYPPFNPGSGAVIPQRLGTPAGKIKTFPNAPKPQANPAPVNPGIKSVRTVAAS